MRKFTQTEKSKFTTKQGIILNLELFKSLALATDMVDTAINKNEDLHYQIRGNIFLTVRSESPCVDIRKYWTPENEVNLVPTKKGLCLRPAEYVNLKSHVSNLEKKFPNLKPSFPVSCVTIIKTSLGCFCVQHATLWNMKTGEKSIKQNVNTKWKRESQVLKCVLFDLVYQFV